MTSIGSTTNTLSNYIGSAYGGTSTTTTTTSATTSTADADTAAQNSSATAVTLSAEAQAYLTSATTATTTSAATAAIKTATELASIARQWFDQQYDTLEVSSAMNNGKVVVDFTDQDRATLSAIAANTGELFSHNEVKAATLVLQARFDDEIGPYVAVARLTGDYASVYEAAQAYMADSGDDEKATALWKAQSDALAEGLAAAKANGGKAPDTGNANDPVRSLLDRTSSGTTLPGTDITDVASQARAMLDIQINSAADDGSELVFDAGRRIGRQVDYSEFDNRTLAAIAQNQGDHFSAEEIRSAKVALDKRNRESILAAMQSAESTGDPRSNSLALLQQYAGMSTEERAVMGYTQDFAERIAQNYRTLTMLQNAIASSGSTGLEGLLG